MKDLIVQLFGAYTPVTYMETVSSVVEGETVIDYVETVAHGAAGLDWPWIMGVVLFAICLWSLFRMIGILLGGK